MYLRTLKAARSTNFFWEEIFMPKSQLGGILYIFPPGQGRYAEIVEAFSLRRLTIPNKKIPGYGAGNLILYMMNFLLNCQNRHQLDMQTCKFGSFLCYTNRQMREAFIQMIIWGNPVCIFPPLIFPKWTWTSPKIYEY